MNVIEDESESRRGLMMWLISSQIVAAGTLCYWLGASGLIFMVFDQGYSQQGMIIAVAVWLYPIFPITMAICAWIAYKHHKDVLSAILSGLTFVPLILFVLILLRQYG